MRNQKTP
ncbi:hypothetical protein CGLO_11524 [Colletotrichum gloeosporioides Cg-14]|nr:hypothetical protein CGLO_11524 [Colletotrichum gloeosporioides Cg-14]